MPRGVVSSASFGQLGLDSGTRLHKGGGANGGAPWQGPNPLRGFSQNLILGGPNGLFPPGSPSIEVGAKPPTSIDGFRGGKRPFGPPKSGFETNFSKGWVPARGPPSYGGGQIKTRIFRFCGSGRPREPGILFLILVWVGLVKIFF